MPEFDERDLEDLARVLRATRPQPSDAYVSETERALLGRPARPADGRRIFAALGFSGGLAAVLLVAGLTGGGPLAPGGNEQVRAIQDCQTVLTTRIQPVREIVKQADGSTVVVTREQPVARVVRRCR
jgi:hypothetical protein